MIDYSNGRYTVKDMSGKVVGRIDNDEFVRDGGKLRFRIDGDEVYELVGAGDLIGFIQPGGTITAPRGQALYRIEAE
jgi:hypothetical protein